jgi:diaminohydroxyphosphoribosylaminopyrimidine deaminase/5-amino-6-(5-phosphoribosylamino)uracil reductase
VVLDSRLRTPLDSQLVKTADQDVLIFFSQGSGEAQRALEARGVRVQQIGQEGQRISLRDVLLRLGELQITNLLLEGGAEVHTTALNQDLVDKLMLFYAPRFLGQTAVPMLGSVQGMAPIQHYALKKFGEDFAFEAYLHDPWVEMKGLG